MPTLQTAGISGAEFDTPEPDSFVADCDTALGKEIFDIAVTEVEAIVEPDSVGDDIRRESMTFVSIHRPILSISAS
jgi:hypothetical protein